MLLIDEGGKLDVQDLDRISHLVDEAVIDRAAKEYTLLSIQIYVELCGSDFLRTACGGSEEESALLDRVVLKLHAADVVLGAEHDAGSDASIEGYRAVANALRPLGALLESRRLFEAASQKRAAHRLRHRQGAAIGQVEDALRGVWGGAPQFSMRDYFAWRASRAKDNAAGERSSA